MLNALALRFTTNHINATLENIGNGKIQIEIDHKNVERLINLLPRHIDRELGITLEETIRRMVIHKIITMDIGEFMDGYSIRISDMPTLWLLYQSARCGCWDSFDRLWDSLDRPIED